MNTRRRLAKNPGIPLDRGGLRRGLELMAHYRGVRFNAVVEEDPTRKLVIRVGDRRFASLSGAACFVTGNQTNGWRFWRRAE